ncbi:DUF4232 domain-containing protein [Streptomyces sp. SID8366]|uniref:DUF4232 domain-containing protein n=1 Tax=unclassified Streptomyces TaxID=2593676 RepID=UPI000DB9A42B|nr:MULTISPECIES: DUF4232 domain-containing protein [unclassified Streptomyces]MYU07759.1 DUF4232 domain-containing protein [Streptomyces sp. SID8366]MYU64247.1 DUF4232 domain-containing protein [Streptomyces sp. SID69]RAJ49591.1 uncharacterized protein DUF4232 [Streptomyces sp. PsTaAH-130]
MRNRLALRTPTPLLAAAGAALAALALTACDSGTGTKDEGAARHTPAASVSAGAPSTDAHTQQGSTGSTAHGIQTSAGTHRATGGTQGTHASGGTGGSKSSGNPWDPKNRVLCNGSNTKVTAQVLSRPLNHMMLTVKNTGSKYCDLTYYPVLRFDGMQWAPGADESTQPQAVTTLAPGESGYAGVLLSAADGSGDGGQTGHKLTVHFQGMTPNSDGGATANVTLPSKGVYYDSSLKVTYWVTDPSDIASW